MTADPLSPVTLISSKDEDPTVLNATVHSTVDRLVGDEDRTLAVEELADEELTVGHIVDACQTPPLFTQRRVVVVRDVGRWNTEELAPLLEYLATPLPSTALVLVGGGGRVAKRLLDALEKAGGTLIDASVPSGRGRDRWMAERLRAAGLRLDQAATVRVVEHLGSDVGRLDSLVETLVVAFGESARIGVDDVEPFLGSSGAVAPWDLTEAIDRGDTQAALGVLARLMGPGERHPLALLAILTRHYGAALRLDGASARSPEEAAALVGMAPFPAGKALAAAQRLGPEGIARVVTLLADADLDLRGQRDWPAPLVMEILVARLSRLGPRRTKGSTAGRGPARYRR